MVPLQMERMKAIALAVMEVDLYATKEPRGDIVTALLKHLEAPTISAGRQMVGYGISTKW